MLFCVLSIGRDGDLTCPPTVVVETDLVWFHLVSPVAALGWYGQCYGSPTLYVSTGLRAGLFPFLDRLLDIRLSIAYTFTLKRPSVDIKKGEKCRHCRGQASRYLIFPPYLPSGDTSLESWTEDTVSCYNNWWWCVEPKKLLVWFLVV